MARPSFRRTSLRFARALLAAVVVLGCGCAGTGSSAPRYRFFELPDSVDAWTPQISGWQARERAVPDTELLRPDAITGEAPVSEGGAGGAGASATRGELRAEYFSFRADRKRELARELAAWIQGEAKRHYIPDGPVDHWATLEETLARNGDDCDGLELLSFHFLLDLGFRPDEVYRAIVFRASDGQHHMVTLWFESPDDPWVIDPTGAMTGGMPRLSELPGWAPLKLFTEQAEYTVRSNDLSPAGAVARRAP
jgi:hypothetical protein